MFLKKKLFPEILFLLMISAVVYLPNLSKLTYYTDDWYYIYDGMMGGAKVFHEMFRIDRPARGYFFEIYFSLFGPNPLPYHIGVFVWRGLSAIGALWIFDILWRNARRFNFFAALLFAIYPGYFWWISAIEYQPMIASLALQVFSIAFTLKAIKSSQRASKIGYLTGAIFTGWLYIALVDYAIGMEIFRFLCVYLLIGHDTDIKVWNRLINTFKVWAWNLFIPAGFLIWRILFFTNERRATDIGTQLGVFFEKPIATIIFWFFQFYNSLLNIGILAWINQFPYFLQNLRLRDTLTGLLTAMITLLVVFLADRIIKKLDEAKIDARVGEHNSHKQEALFLGSLGMMFGILPVIMANRYINTIGFSHYALPVSLAAAVFVTAFIESLSIKRVRFVLLYVVIAFAALAHYGISIKAVTEETALQKFWWQVSWRVPAFRAGTMLVVHYPIPGMEGDGYGLMEAANIIYFPEPTGQTPVVYPLAGLNPSNQNLQDILDGTLYRQWQYRSHIVNFDYANILVISQPRVTSCVHVINGTQPLISTSDPVNVALVAPSSKIDNVIIDVEPTTPPEYIFGEEPKHGWCFYFQKADLAAQLGDWERVAYLGEEAINLELSPDDRVEWLPFLKAYAITGNAEGLSQIAKRVVGEKALRIQICEMFSSLEVTLSEEVNQVITEDYCRAK